MDSDSDSDGLDGSELSESLVNEGLEPRSFCQPQIANLVNVMNNYE